MKTKIYALFITLLSVAMFSCSDDDNVAQGEYNPEREFMTMFRQESNTGENTSSDPYGSKVVGTNDIQLHWYGIKGARGYRIQMKFQTTGWEPENILMDTIVGPDVLSLFVEDLQYNTVYNFAIQTLSVKGDEYNSKWYGYGDSSHGNDRCEIQTLERYAVPDVLYVDEITDTSFRVHYDLTYNEDYAEHFEGKDGKFVMDEIKVEPSAINRDLPTLSFKLTEEDLERGYIDVNGLVSNAVYVVNGFNNNIERYWDRLYNTCMVRMKGDPGEPVLIKHQCDTTVVAQEYNASRLDTILNNYMADNTYAEGTVFLLEGGKTYYMRNTVSMSKGFTLKSNDPEKKAIVLMGIGKDESGNPILPNFSFGRNPQAGEMGSINVQSIRFENIKFDAPEALNSGQVPSMVGSGNYFINQYSGAMAFSLESFEIENCEFQHFIRGFIRFQGPNRKLMQKFVINNSLFYNCGWYDNNGRGYSWIQGDGKNANTNIFMDLSITNCSFIDSPRHAFISENTNLAWTGQWHIRVENNTFLNFSTRTSGRHIFEMRYWPANSTIICRKNLFILTKADNDSRPMYQTGMDIRQFVNPRFEFEQNYSTNTNLTNGQIFTGYSFSNTRGAGYEGGKYNIYGRDELEVHLGADGGISPTELMKDPNPLGLPGEVNMHEHNIEGLYYNNTDKVRNSDIYKLGIGDPRWAKYVTP